MCICTMTPLYVTEGRTVLVSHAVGRYGEIQCMCQSHDPRLSIFTRLPALAESVNIASIISLDLRMRRFSVLRAGAESAVESSLGELFRGGEL